MKILTNFFYDIMENTSGQTLCCRLIKKRPHTTFMLKLLTKLSINLNLYLGRPWQGCSRFVSKEKKMNFFLAELFGSIFGFAVKILMNPQEDP